MILMPCQGKWRKGVIMDAFEMKTLNDGSRLVEKFADFAGSVILQLMQKQGYVEEQGIKALLNHIKKGGGTLTVTLTEERAEDFKELLKEAHIPFVEIEHVDATTKERSIFFVYRDCDQAGMKEVLKKFELSLDKSCNEVDLETFEAITDKKNFGSVEGLTKEEVYAFREAAEDYNIHFCVVGNKDNYRIVTQIKDKNGKVVATGENKLSVFDNTLFEQEFAVANPELWSPETPVLYMAESKVYEGNTLKDEYTTRFGIRTLEIIPDKGFFLNGKLTKFKGVCNHHDLGPLGGAVNDAAIRRQIRILKDMGCNAIRTSHNMPAPELVEACDEMGMMVMAESFDEWKSAKMANGYHKVFDEWVDKDLTNLIRHYRNNPSIVMWCTGNEVPDQWSGSNGPKISRMLQDICHREDPTRPVTQGMDAPDAVVNNNMAAVMDVAGFNYRPHKYPENYKKLPQQIILGSETASTVSSRGVYKFPVVRQAMKKYDDHQSSSYDVEHCGWSNLPEDDWIWHEDNAWGIGEFVWTGFDYLGEPTPYYTDWPSHSSLFGIIDLAGLPKDRYYLYRSHWNKDEETLHILPHWTWPGREGEVTPIFVYTNYPSAEVFINGKSQGKRTKDLTVTAENSADSASIADFKRQKRYRLMWMDTKYEPGTVKVVAYNEKGDAVAEKEIHTAGKPDHIELVADRNEIKADGKDLSFVTVRVVDKEGNLCPDAQHLIKYAVKGAGTYRAGANGDPTSLELFHVPQMKVFNGMMTAVVQSTDKPGEITLTATGKGLKSGRLVLISK